MLRRRPRINEIIAVVAEYYGVPIVAIEGSLRTKSVATARHVVFWVAKKVTIMSNREIGLQVNGSDPSTVLFGLKSVEKNGLKEDAEMIVDFFEKDIDMQVTR